MEHFFALSPHHIPHMNDVYDMVRSGCEYGFLVDIYECHSQRAAIHLGNDYYVNLRNIQSSPWRTTGQLFGDIEKLISGQTETSGINLIDSQELRWISTSLLHNRAHQYATAKVYVFSDSVLCLGRSQSILEEPDYVVFRDQLLRTG